MGDNYIAEKAKGFQHKAEKEHAEKFSSPGLFAAIEDISQRVVRFVAGGPVLPHGTKVRFLEEHRDLITVLQRTSRIGEVDQAGTAELRALFSSHPELGGAVPAKVINGPDWSGAYDAVVSHME